MTEVDDRRVLRVSAEKAEGLPEGFRSGKIETAMEMKLSSPVIFDKEGSIINSNIEVDSLENSRHGSDRHLNSQSEGSDDLSEGKEPQPTPTPRKDLTFRDGEWVDVDSR